MSCRKYWVAADDAFKPCPQVITPYPGQHKCIGEEDSDGDSVFDPDGDCHCQQCTESGFNFWLSNSRITIECAFGMLGYISPFLGYAAQ